MPFFSLRRFCEIVPKIATIPDFSLIVWYWVTALYANVKISSLASPKRYDKHASAITVLYYIEFEFKEVPVMTTFRFWRHSITSWYLALRQPYSDHFALFFRGLPGFVCNFAVSSQRASIFIFPVSVTVAIVSSDKIPSLNSGSSSRGGSSTATHWREKSQVIMDWFATICGSLTCLTQDKTHQCSTRAQRNNDKTNIYTKRASTWLNMMCD